MNNETRSKIAAALRSAAAKLMAAEATDVLFSINETLNPALWDENKKLKPEVKQTLQEISDDFADGFDYPLDVIDVIVTGSSANYNWNRFSDVDLHLVVDYDSIPEKYMPAFLDYADAKRKLWNQEHNIELFGHEVEVYVQPEQDTLEAAGVYSLMKDEWLAEPKRQEPKADKATVEKKAARFHELVDAIQEMVEAGEDDLAYNSATILKDRIRKFRQSGLEKGGEFAAENLVFKTLRNDGTLERLDTLHKQAYDKGQSLSAAVERPSRPDEGSMSSLGYPELVELVHYEIDKEIERKEEDEGYIITLRTRPDADEVEQLLVGEAGLNDIESFDNEAWLALLDHIPTALMAGRGEQLGRGIPDDTVEDAYAMAVDLWENHNGGHYCYFGAIGSGISIKDGWYNVYKELDLKVLWQKMAPELRSAAHDLENAVFSAASIYVDQHAEREGQEEEEVNRGPEHDTVVYRYAGTNDTIGAASAKGMYVAELGLNALRDESKEMGHCIGNPQHGHPQLLEAGITRIFSIRTEAGKTKFTIEQFIKDGVHPQQGKVKAGTVTEVKGKANRLPGFEPNKTEMTKPDEVRLVVEFLMKYLGLTPSQVEATNDIRGGVKAMQAMGQDPFSPPPKKAERPKRDPRALEAAVRLVKADYQRVALLSRVASA